jgi:hypothetical protein
MSSVAVELEGTRRGLRAGRGAGSTSGRRSAGHRPLMLRSKHNRVHSLFACAVLEDRHKLIPFAVNIYKFYGRQNAGLLSLLRAESETRRCAHIRDGVDDAAWSDEHSPMQLLEPAGKENVS